MSTAQVRALTIDDWTQAKALYAALTLGPREFEYAHFEAVLSHPGTQVLGAFEGDMLRAMATLHVLPNVTWSGRSYALVENVITAADHRSQGYGRMVMSAITETAWAANAYKFMLLTGQKRCAAGFYEACGFSSEDKHAMVLRRT